MHKWNLCLRTSRHREFKTQINEGSRLRYVLQTLHQLQATKTERQKTHQDDSKNGSKARQQSGTNEVLTEKLNNRACPAVPSEGSASAMKTASSSRAESKETSEPTSLNRTGACAKLDTWQRQLSNQ